MNRWWRLTRVAALGCLGAQASQLTAQSSQSWPFHGHDLGGQRYSPLTSIDTANAATLTEAWTYHSGVTATFRF
ncbi:MAG: hypothetical protein ABI743_12955 [bacterium]